MVAVNESEPRQLSDADYRLMNLPDGFRDALPAEIDESIRDKCTNYMNNREELLGKGWGLLFFGEPRTGSRLLLRCYSKRLDVEPTSVFLWSTQSCVLLSNTMSALMSTRPSTVGAWM